MATVDFAQSARTDLLEIWLFIAEENLNAADRVLDTIEQEAGILATQPFMGRARPDLAQDIDVGVAGGTVVTVTEKLGNVTGDSTTTQGKSLVTGSALTTSVVVNQDKAAAAAAAVVGGNAAVVGVVNDTVTIADANAATAATDTISPVTLNSYANATIDSTVLAPLNLAGVTFADNTFGVLANVTAVTFTGSAGDDSFIAGPYSQALLLAPTR